MSTNRFYIENWARLYRKVGFDPIIIYHHYFSKYLMSQKLSLMAKNLKFAIVYLQHMFKSVLRILVDEVHTMTFDIWLKILDYRILIQISS